MTPSEGVDAPELLAMDHKEQLIAGETDMLLIYSTSSGEYAWRGVFTKTFREKVIELHQSRHLTDILTVVKRNLSTTQLNTAYGAVYVSPWTNSSLTKNVWLEPKVNEAERSEEYASSSEDDVSPEYFVNG